MATIIKVKIGRKIIHKPVFKKNGDPVIVNGEQVLVPQDKRIYPDNIDHNKVEWLGWESNYDPQGVKARGVEFIIGVIHDRDKDQFISPPDCIEINRAAAIALGSVWLPQIDRIFDYGAVNNVLNKVLNRQQLTQDDYDIIDPNNSKRGVHKSLSYTYRLDELLAKERFNG